MSEEARNRFSRRARWGIAAGALLLGLVLAEVTLRVAAPLADPNAGVLEPIVHDRFVVSLHPPQTTVFTPDTTVLPGLSERTTFTVNAFGFRSPRLASVEKPAGALRVFAVGGSTTECLYLDDGEAWPELVHEALVGELPGLDVINTGRSGDSTREHLALLAHRIAAFRPDAVLLLVGLNDLDLFLRPDYAPLGDARSQLRHPRFSTTQGALAKLTRRSHLARGLTWLVRGQPTEVAGNPVQDGYGAWVAGARARLRAAPERALSTAEVEALPPPEYARNLRMLVALCRSQGALPVLITQPAVWGAPPGAWEERLWFQPRPGQRIPPAQLATLLARVNAVTRAVAKAEGAACVDLASGLAKDPAFVYDDAHFTVAGAAAVARQVVAGLRAQRVVKRLRARTTPGE